MHAIPPQPKFLRPNISSNFMLMIARWLEDLGSNLSRGLLLLLWYVDNPWEFEFVSIISVRFTHAGWLLSFPTFKLLTVFSPELKIFRSNFGARSNFIAQNFLLNFNHFAWGLDRNVALYIRGQLIYGIGNLFLFGSNIWLDTHPLVFH